MRVAQRLWTSLHEDPGGATFLALVPAFVAAYLGVAVRAALAAGSAGEAA